MAKYDYSNWDAKVKHSHNAGTPFIEIDESSLLTGDTYAQGSGYVGFKKRMIRVNFRYTGRFDWDRPDKSIAQTAELSSPSYGSVEMLGLNWNLGKVQSTAASKFLKKSFQEDDRIIGSKYNDTIKGYGGDDVIDGRAGRNVLTGGKGKDVFVLHNKGMQIIKDFDFSEDDLDFTRVTLEGDMEIRDIGRDAYVFFGFSQLAILVNVN